LVSLKRCTRSTERPVVLALRDTPFYFTLLGAQSSIGFITSSVRGQSSRLFQLCSGSELQACALLVSNLRELIQPMVYLRRAPSGQQRRNPTERVTVHNSRRATLATEGCTLRFRESGQQLVTCRSQTHSHVIKNCHAGFRYWGLTLNANTLHGEH